MYSVPPPCDLQAAVCALSLRKLGNALISLCVSVCLLRSGRQPAAVHPVLPAAAGGRGKAAQDVPPGAAVSGRVAGRTPGAGAGGRGSALRPGQ